MRNLPRLLVLGSLGLGLANLACGGSSSPASPATAPTATGSIRQLTQAQNKVAHYASADGTLGLVLDRSGDKPKYRVDGAADIVELTMQEDRFGGELRGYFLVAPDGKRPIYITVDGSLKYFRGQDELWLNTDKPATALPAATVTGTYVAPKPAYQATLDRLTGVAVRTKLSQFKPEDSASLAKVGDAVSQATADMFVHFASHGSKDYLPSLTLVPESFHGIEFGGVARDTDVKWDPTAKGLAKYGGKNEGFSSYETPKGNHMQVMKLAGYPPPLADGTPGLVWDLNGTTATFVTLDGGRYNFDLSNADKGANLDAGAGPQSGWPAPLQHPLLDVAAVSSLAKVGALPQKSIDDLLALDQQWTECAAKQWAGAQRTVDTGRFTEADRKDWVKKARTACASSIKKQEAMLVVLIEARNKDRQALMDKAKARVASVGADK
jgi:hypothetical protein